MTPASWAGRRVWVTGGLGFIGSNLALRLLALGSEVTIVDPCVEGCGGDEENIAPHGGAMRIIRRNIAEVECFADALRDADVVFNLAGEISHARSMREPLRDLELNTVAQLQFLETLARVRPGIRVVYAGTRQIYGQARRLPVDEDHAIRPTDYNGAHKRAAEFYHLMLSDKGWLDAIVLRLTNTYGPRLSMKAEGQGFLSVFLRRVLEGKPIEVFGDGSQLRDPVYVDDVVDAFILAGTVESPAHRVFNVGATTALTLNEIARIMTSAAGGVTEPVLRPFPDEHKAVDIGSYVADTRRIQAELGWAPKVGFDAGVRKTLDWLREQALQR